MVSYSYSYFRVKWSFRWLWKRWIDSCSIKLKSIWNKLINFFEYTIYIRIYFESGQQVFISTVYELYNFDARTAFKIVSLWISCLFSIIFIWIILIIFIKWRSTVINEVSSFISYIVWSVCKRIKVLWALQRS